MTIIDRLGQQAKAASSDLANLATSTKNKALYQIAKDLLESEDYILAENARDVDKAEENGISEIMVDRLLLTRERLEAIATGLRQVADLPDPIGQVVRGYTNMDGLKIVQERVPLGVIAMIFESRPNVSVDAFSLAFTTGTRILFRGGRPCNNSNKALTAVVRKSLGHQGITPDTV